MLALGASTRALAQTATGPDAAAAATDAPQANTASNEGGEILVTARKRTESLQDVPISVAVIGGARLQEQNLGTIESLATVTSGLVIRKTPNNQVNLTLRGLGTGTAVDAFEQSVATFIDGTYAGRGPEFNAALFDVDRIEVIRGAQASLLSKNTSLGAISITTRKPGNDFGVDAVANYEFALGSHSIETGIDLPVSDTLRVRIAGKYDVQGGWVYNRATDHDLGRTVSYAGRVVAVWEPTDSIDASLVYQHFRYKQRGLPIEYFSDPDGQVASLSALAGDPGFETRVDRRTAHFSSAIGDDSESTRGNRIIANLNYDLGNDYSITSVSSYSDYRRRQLRDSDYLVGDYVLTTYRQSNSQVQQEVRLTSPAEGRLIDYVIGGAFFHEIWRYNGTLDAQCPGCSATQRARFLLRGALSGDDRQKTTNYAAFVQANLHLTETFTLSGGARYTNERRSATLSRDVITPGALTAVLYNPFAPLTLRRKEDNVDYSLGANWKATPTLLLYANVSKGTKSGGFDNAPTNPTTPAGRIAAEYASETARSYEAGFKLTLPHGGFFNVNLFQTNVHNFQNAVFINPRFVITSRDLTAKGVEVESAVELVPGVRLQGQLSFADTRRKDGTNLRPAGAPRWTGNAMVTFNHPISEDFTLTGDAGVEFRSRLFLTDENLTTGFRGSTTNQIPASEAYGMINARIGIKHHRGWDLALIGRNLNNKLVYQYSVPTTLISNFGAVVQPNLPRTVALQVGYHF
jgi:iron complex outermembrane receptor protein